MEKHTFDEFGLCFECDAKRGEAEMNEPAMNAELQIVRYIKLATEYMRNANVSADTAVYAIVPEHYAHSVLWYFDAENTQGYFS